MAQGWQWKKVIAPVSGSAKGWELAIPNPKLKLMDQVREVVRCQVVDGGELIATLRLPCAL